MSVIAARAATIPERFREGWEADPLVEGGARPRDLLRRWRETVAGGDRGRFARRLAGLGTDEAGAVAVLAGVRRAPGQSHPPWEIVLEDLLAAPSPRQTTGHTGRIRFAPPHQRLAVAPWLPLVARARERLRGSRVHRPPLLTAHAEAKLVRQLLHSLVLTGEAVPGIEVVDAALFDRYPMLARFVATLASEWVDATAEFLDRLEADMDALATQFGAGGPPGPVVDIDAGISDRHRGGRTVLSLRFASGLRAVYKPRDPSAEATFQRFLEWLRRRGLSPAIAPLTVVNRGTHGWFEFARGGPCRSREGVRRFYLRTGALLAIVDLLGARDCHLENVAACGDRPVLLDAETLLHRRPSIGEVVRDADGAIAVLATGLTPYWKPGVTGYLPNAGVGGSAGGPSRRNVPTFRGASIGPLEHIEEIIAGFRHTREFLAGYRGELLQPDDGPLAPLARCRIRVLRRDTRAYTRLIRDGLRPERLRDGVEWSLGIESLAAEVLVADRPREAESLRIVDDEQAALTRLDVPLLTARAEDTGLELDSGAMLEGYFPASGVAELAERIDSLADEAALEERVGLIRAAYALAGVADRTDLRARRKRTT